MTANVKIYEIKLSVVKAKNNSSEKGYFSKNIIKLIILLIIHNNKALNQS